MDSELTPPRPPGPAATRIGRVTSRFALCDNRSLLGPALAVSHDDHHHGAKTSLPGERRRPASGWRCQLGTSRDDSLSALATKTKTKHAENVAAPPAATTNTNMT